MKRDLVRQAKLNVLASLADMAAGAAYDGELDLADAYDHVRESLCNHWRVVLR